MPFVPPRADESSYKERPSQVSLKAKLIVCFAVYLQYQLGGAIIGVAGAAVLAIMHRSDFFNYRHLVFFPLVMIVPTGLIGLVLAIYYFVVFHIRERRGQPLL
jgi:F0F1-type ATP synthase membrane subunit c/vacuolar-type H+-ATPase subunit K